VTNEREVRILSHVPLPLLARVSERFPKASLVAIPDQGALPDGVRGDVLLTMAWGSPNLPQILARGVRWVHAYGTGVNAFPFGELRGTPLTCSRGASAISISEWVIAMMLCAEKRLPDAWIHEPPAVWNIFDLGGLYGRTLGLLGMGGIAQETAKRALAFGMTVIANRRTAQPSPVPGVEMVDFDALRAALDDGHVSLASLDTVSPEPLPAGHWLFTHPRVRLSPHCSWSGPGALDRLLDPFLANLARWLEGSPLEGLVDVELGY
jgi:phosphoglycerate dehydrogenase-like enzyme